ncbi:unnamed protein product [Mytilus coruscus]|uniref:Reverse transcriptase domain-containing protein n=1 Tax=Mytilus coruscus TaxID=42192 RepID=A0A6J8EFS7_MYTCO|nr:unnamed protein product [Mytilus coruscus]
MAALILSEVYSEINGKDLLFITTLDSQKAFDVINHQILLDKLYYLGVDIEYWDVIEDMYNGVTSTVKWQGDTSLSFSIDQGVRQGGILSSHLYKQYINELLSELEAHNMGISIGNTYAGCPSCADDIVLLSNDQNEMQEMLNTVYDYSSDHRFLIHPVKSNTIVKSINKRTSERIQQTTTNFTLGDNIMEFKSETTHLGLKRTTSEETKININDRISLARRTLYSLIKTGVHGTNGLNPRTSCKIYQVYVIPRLLYGLEILNLQNKDTVALCSFHLSTL